MRQRRAAATGGSVVREESQGKATGTRGKCERGRGSCVATPGDVQAVGEAGKQGGGGRARAGARWPRALPTGARWKATGAALVGWAGLQQCWAQGKSFLSFFSFLFLFCFISFATLFN